MPLQNKYPNPRKEMVKTIIFTILITIVAFYSGTRYEKRKPLPVNIEESHWRIKWYQKQVDLLNLEMFVYIEKENSAVRGNKGGG